MALQGQRFFGFNSTQERTLRDLFDNDVFANASVGTSELADGAVTGAKLGAISSAQLRTALSDETGTGAAVFANGPTLIAPVLGTPASGVMTNMTGLVNAGVDAAAAIAATKLAAAAGTDGLGAGTVQAALQAVYTAVANLNTWAAALATKLNADAGVTDTDYDTDPQA